MLLFNFDIANILCFFELLSCFENFFPSFMLKNIN